MQFCLHSCQLQHCCNIYCFCIQKCKSLCKDELSNPDGCWPSALAAAGGVVAVMGLSSSPRIQISVSDLRCLIRHQANGLEETYTRMASAAMSSTTAWCGHRRAARGGQEHSHAAPLQSQLQPRHQWHRRLERRRGAAPLVAASVLRPDETPEQALERRLRESAQVEERVCEISGPAQWESALAAAGDKLVGGWVGGWEGWMRVHCRWGE